MRDRISKGGLKKKEEGERKDGGRRRVKGCGIKGMKEKRSKTKRVYTCNNVTSSHFKTLIFSPYYITFG